MSLTPKVGFVSLGCPKALTDSELILTQLSAEGYVTSKTFDGADLVIVNTCGFIDDAVKESLDTISEALAANGKVIVTGCLGAKSGPDGQNLVKGLHPSGCNHRCSFCIIPSMRGDLKSRPIGDVLNEALALLESGVKELLIISQDTSAYGVDIRYQTGFFQGRPIKSRLYELVEALAELAEPFGAWIRLHYVYPYPAVDEIIPMMATGRVLPYLDVPFQHSHPDVLKRMKRPASGEKNIERIHAWRKVCPQLVVRSTFIAGFPGETQSEFQHMLDFLKEAQIDHAGCFAYSAVDGATANELPGMLALELRQERQAEFMAVAQNISAKKITNLIGSTMQVLVDKSKSLGRGGGVGRSYRDAPEIDGVVHLLAPEKVSKTYRTGEFTKVKILDSQGLDLIGLPI